MGAGMSTQIGRLGQIDWMNLDKKTIRRNRIKELGEEQAAVGGDEERGRVAELDYGEKAAGQDEEADERHRHRFEVNNSFRAQLADAGLVVSGASPDGRLAEIMELEGHPFFVGVQFHPESILSQERDRIIRNFLAGTEGYHDSESDSHKTCSTTGSQPC